MSESTDKEIKVIKFAKYKAEYEIGAVNGVKWVRATDEKNELDKSTWCAYINLLKLIKSNEGLSEINYKRNYKRIVDAIIYISNLMDDKGVNPDYKKSVDNILKPEEEYPENLDFVLLKEQSSIFNLHSFIDVYNQKKFNLEVDKKFKEYKNKHKEDFTKTDEYKQIFSESPQASCKNTTRSKAMSYFTNPEEKYWQQIKNQIATEIKKSQNYQKCDIGEERVKVIKNMLIQVYWDLRFHRSEISKSTARLSSHRRAQTPTSPSKKALQLEENSDKREQNKDLQVEIERLKLQLKQITDKKSELEINLAKANEEKTELQSKIVENEQTIKDLKLKIDELQTKGKEFENIIAQLTQKNENLQSKLRNVSDAKSKFEIQLQEKEESLKEIASQFEELQKGNEELKTKSSDLTKQNDSLQVEIKSKNNEIESLTQQLQQITGEMDGVQTNLAKSNAENDEIKKKLEENELKFQELQKEIEQEAEEMAKLREKNKEFETQIQEKEKNIEELNQKIAQLTQENSELKSSLKNVSKEKEAAKVEFESQIENLKSQLQEKIKENESFNLEISQKQSEIDNLSKPKKVLLKISDDNEVFSLNEFAPNDIMLEKPKTKFEWAKFFTGVSLAAVGVAGLVCAVVPGLREILALVALYSTLATAISSASVGIGVTLIGSSLWNRFGSAKERAAEYNNQQNDKVRLDDHTPLLAQ